MTRLGLQDRRDELVQHIEALGAQPEETAASAALFFGGGPVVAARGIESEFGGQAITTFQDIVAKLCATENGGLAQRGVVPHKETSTLHITNIVRGSFGFLLEEMQPQGAMVDSALKAAVTEATTLLGAFGEPSEENFQTEVAGIDQRVFDTVGEFFKLMESSDATFRVVAGNLDETFTRDAIERAVNRAATTKVEEIEATERGQLGGVLPAAHKFEFRTAGPRGVIEGKVDNAITPAQLAEFNLTLVNVEADAKLRIRRVLRDGEVVRERFTLLSIAPVQPPA